MSDLFGDQATAIDFEAFWLLYPRRVGKGAARKAFEKALPKIKTNDPFQTLCDATVLFADAVRLGDIRFIPHPATYLNQERWNDCIEDIRRAHAPQPVRPDPREQRDDRTSRMLQGFVRATEQRRTD